MAKIKIGQLAKRVGCLPSTIHFYTQEGLLTVAGTTRGGYRLYEEKYALDRIERIHKLKTKQRLTLAEIKKVLRVK
ncbi:MAG: MerR family transcriptional regulator [Candidatus Komeilibacteria bacterium]